MIDPGMSFDWNDIEVVKAAANAKMEDKPLFLERGPGPFTYPPNGIQMFEGTMTSTISGASAAIDPCNDELGFWRAAYYVSADWKD